MSLLERVHGATNSDSAGELRVQTTIASSEPSAADSDQLSRTVPFSKVIDRLALYMLPMGIVANLLAPVPVDIVQRVRTRSSTRSWADADLEAFWDDWHLATERVLPSEVTMLTTLWAMKIPPDFDHDFRVYD